MFCVDYLFRLKTEVPTILAENLTPKIFKYSKFIKYVGFAQPIICCYNIARTKNPCFIRVEYIEKPGRVFCCFSPRCLYIIKQMRKRSLSHVLHCDKTLRAFEKTFACSSCFLHIYSLSMTKNTHAHNCSELLVRALLLLLI